MVFLEHLKQSAARDAYLNAIDAQIESSYMQATLDGEPAKKNRGLCSVGDF